MWGGRRYLNSVKHFSVAFTGSFLMLLKNKNIANNILRNSIKDFNVCMQRMQGGEGIGKII